MYASTASSVLILASPDLIRSMARGFAAASNPSRDSFIPDALSQSSIDLISAFPMLRLSHKK